LFTIFFGPIAYAMKIIISGDATPEEIGILYGVVSLVVLLSTYNDFGFTEALNYYLPKAINDRNWARFNTLVLAAFAMQVISSIVIGGSLYVWSGWLAEHYFGDPRAAEVLRIFCLFFVGINLFQILNTVFQASQNTFLQKSTEFARMASMLLFVVAIWWGPDRSIESYAWAWIGGVAVGVVASLPVFVLRYWRPYLAEAGFERDPALLRTFAKYALGSLFTANIAMILSQIDMQIVIVALGTREAGYYSNYLSLVSIPFVFSAPLMQFLFPVVSQFRPEEAAEKITALKNLLFKFLFLGGVLAGTLLFVYARPIAVFFFGETFRESGSILVYSSLFVAFNFLLQTNFQILAGTGHIRTRIYILLAGLAANLALSVALVGPLGARGVSLAVGVAWAFMYAASEYATREYRLRAEAGFVAKNGVFAGACMLAAPYLSALVPADRWEAFGWLFILSILHILAFMLVNIADVRALISGVRTIKSPS
jgi:O-antigen/teichoic acid export membrane protein